VIVADAALIACFTVRNERSALADAVCATDAVWAAPLLWRSELRNVLAACQRALAARSKCTAFECEYVVLAQDLGVPLVTPDRRIVRAFPGTAVALERFTRKK